MNDTMNVSAMLTEQIERLFENAVTRQVLETAEAGDLPASLWQELEDLGIPMALVPEDADGVGLPWRDIEGVWRAMGHHAAPLPLGETMIGRWALASAGITMPDGPLAISGDMLTLDEHSQLQGGDIFVPWAAQTDHLVLVAKRNGQAHLCLVRCTDADAVTQQSISRIPAARLTLTQVTPAAIAPVTNTLPGDLGLLPYLAALRATQMTGCLDRLLDLCVEYGNTRQQFGRPLSKFQAVQQMIATLAEQTAAARMAGSMGCRGLDKADEFGIAVAKLQAGQSATAATAIAHQVFGAMGVTDEHALHFFTRRLWQWRNEGGNEHWWAERLGQQAIAAGGAALWPTLVND